MATIGAIGPSAPVAPARAVDRVVRKRKSASERGDEREGGPLAAPVSPEATSSSAVLTALIGLHSGG
jgi:hypothetical protein